MTAPLSSAVAGRYIRVDHLTAGDVVRYYGRDWTVQDTLPLFFLDGYGVIGYDPATQERRILLYANRGAVAAVIAP